MPGRMYLAAASAAMTAAGDLLEINSGSAMVTILRGVWISQSSDVDSEQLRITIQRSTGSSGSGGSSVTARPLNPADSAFAGTVEAHNTTIATTLTLLHNEGFNVLNGWQWIPIPEAGIIIAPSGRLVVSQMTTPADSLTFEVSCLLEELG